MFQVFLILLFQSPPDFKDHQVILYYESKNYKYIRWAAQEADLKIEYNFNTIDRHGYCILSWINDDMTNKEIFKSLAILHRYKSIKKILPAKKE